MSEKRILILDEKGFTNEVYSKEVEKELRKNNEQLCSECVYLTSGNCPKVKDSTKKQITGYKFITRGYQVLSERGDVTSFGVYGCKYYKRSSKELADILAKRMIYKTAMETQRELVSGARTRAYTTKKRGDLYKKFMK